MAPTACFFWHLDLWFSRTLLNQLPSLDPFLDANFNCPSSHVFLICTIAFTTMRTCQRAGSRICKRAVRNAIPTAWHMRMFAPGSLLGSVAKCHEKDKSRDFWATSTTYSILQQNSQVFHCTADLHKTAQRNIFGTSFRLQTLLAFTFEPFFVGITGPVLLTFPRALDVSQRGPLNDEAADCGIGAQLSSAGTSEFGAPVHVPMCHVPLFLCPPSTLNVWIHVIISALSFPNVPMSPYLPNVYKWPYSMCVSHVVTLTKALEPALGSARMI